MIFYHLLRKDIDYQRGGCCSVRRQVLSVNILYRNCVSLGEVGIAFSGIKGEKKYDLEGL